MFRTFLTVAVVVSTLISSDALAAKAKSKSKKKAQPQKIQRSTDSESKRKVMRAEKKQTAKPEEVAKAVDMKQAGDLVDLQNSDDFKISYNVLKEIISWNEKAGRCQIEVKKKGAKRFELIVSGPSKTDPEYAYYEKLRFQFSLEEAAFTNFGEGRMDLLLSPLTISERQRFSKKGRLDEFPLYVMFDTKKKEIASLNLVVSEANQRFMAKDGRAPATFKNNLDTLDCHEKLGETKEAHQEEAVKPVTVSALNP